VCLVSCLNIILCRPDGWGNKYQYVYALGVCLINYICYRSILCNRFQQVIYFLTWFTLQNSSKLFQIVKVCSIKPCLSERLHCTCVYTKSRLLQGWIVFEWMLVRLHCACVYTQSRKLQWCLRMDVWGCKITYKKRRN